MLRIPRRRNSARAGRSSALGRGATSGGTCRGIWASSGRPSGSMTSVPRYMFMAQEKGYSPGRSGVSSTVVVANAGSAREIPKSGITTRLEQSVASRRSNLRRTGRPAFTVSTFGW